MLKIYRQGLGKSIAHASIQSYLKKTIPELELEKPLGKRRADALWEEKKIVFEIQISPITLEEVISRIQDYREHGYTVVWILQEGIFNEKLVGPAENFLRTSHPTYYSNGGLIYDQLEVLGTSLRLYRGAALPVQITAPSRPFLPVPGRSWALHFVGDVHTLCAKEGVQEIKKSLQKHLPLAGWKWWLHFAGWRILEFVSTNQR